MDYRSIYCKPIGKTLIGQWISLVMYCKPIGKRIMGQCIKGLMN